VQFTGCLQPGRTAPSVPRIFPVVSMMGLSRRACLLFLLSKPENSSYLLRRNGISFHVLEAIQNKIGQNVSRRNLQKERATQLMSNGCSVVPAHPVRNVVRKISLNTLCGTYSSCVYIRNVNDLGSRDLHSFQLCSQRSSDGFQQRTMRGRRNMEKLGFTRSLAGSPQQNFLHRFDRARNHDLLRGVDVSDEDWFGVAVNAVVRQYLGRL
jgi:hypothetical protein